jgi:acyl carrier protein
MTTFEKLREMIAATLKAPVDRITLDATNERIPGWDSLGHVNLMIALEQTFDVVLEVEDFPKLNSVPSMLKFLDEKGVQ